MGLLDEAIREHLELKRRRGADPTEVERLEREALGPVRRIQQDALPEDEARLAGHMDDLGLVLDNAAEPADLEHEDEFAPEAEALAHEPGHDYEPLDDEYEAEDPDQTRISPPAPEAQETHGVVPPPEPVHAEEPPPPAAPSDHAPPADHARPSERPVYEDPGVETAEYDVEAEHADESDVLEETPEFLQDTPDHDRLWFEQRPPKDFDFDG